MHSPKAVSESVVDCSAASVAKTCTKRPRAEERRSSRLAATSEAAQTGSTDAGSAVADATQSAASNADLLQLMEEIKTKTNGIALLARDCPPEDVHSALEDRVAQAPAELRQREENSNGSFICAPEDFQLEPGAVSHVSPSTNSPLDIFRCSGCTRSECQVCLSWAPIWPEP